MARIPYAEAPGLPPVHIFGVLAHAPELLDAYRELGQRLVFGGELAQRQKELCILGVAADRNCSYLWSHHGDLARSIGVGDGELDAVREGRLDDLDKADGAAVGFARRSEAGQVTAADVEVMTAAGFTPAQLVELSLLAGFYGMTARLLETLDVELEAGRAGLEAR